jgi:hypothetical protein
MLLVSYSVRRRALEFNRLGLLTKDNTETRGEQYTNIDSVLNYLSWIFSSARREMIPQGRISSTLLPPPA